MNCYRKLQFGKTGRPLGRVAGSIVGNKGGENGRRHRPGQAQNFTEVLQEIEQGEAAQETCLYWSFEAIVLTAM